MVTSILSRTHRWSGYANFLPLLLTLNFLTGTVAAQSDHDYLLELNKPLERKLAGGQSHSYRIVLTAGQYLRVVVDQRGIDVIATMFGPEGKQIMEVDSPNGDKGPEIVTMISLSNATYRLHVRSFEKDAPTGRYEIKLEELRTATQKDKDLISADRFFADAESLRQQAFYRNSFSNALTKYKKPSGCTAQ